MSELSQLEAQIAQLEANVREIRDFMGKQGAAIMELSRKPVRPAAGPYSPIVTPQAEQDAYAMGFEQGKKAGYAQGLEIGRRLT